MDGVHAVRRLLVVRLLVVLAASTVAVVGTSTWPAQALNDDLYAKQWGLTMIGAKAAWDRGLLGEGADVAVVDTGAHLTHQDLAKNVRPGRNFIDPSKPPQDDWCDGETCGHGTHVAGIAVGSIDDGGAVGVAPRGGLIPVKGFDSSGAANAAVLAEGIRWAADNGAEVINMSFGPELPIGGTGNDIVEAIRYAWSKGVVCVMSAGNSFIFSSDITDEPVIVVSATTRRDAIADFSNGVGDARWGLAAPGGGDTIQFAADENIWSTVWTPENKNNTYAEMRGTSQAAPFVAGAAALLRSAGLSPQQTVDRLLATAKDLGAAGRDSVYGSGRVDVAKATEGLAPQAVASPTASPAPPASPPASSPAPSTAGNRVSRPPPSGSTAPPPTLATGALPAGTTPPPTGDPVAPLPTEDDRGPLAAGGAPSTTVTENTDDGGGLFPAAAIATIGLLGVAAWAVRTLVVRRPTNAQ